MAMVSTKASIAGSAATRVSTWADSTPGLIGVALRAGFLRATGGLALSLGAAGRATLLRLRLLLLADVADVADVALLAVLAAVLVAVLVAALRGRAVVLAAGLAGRLAAAVRLAGLVA